MNMTSLAAFTKLAYTKIIESVAKKAIFIWLTTAFFYLYQFAIRVSPSVFETDMRIALGVDACTLGGIISLYYWGYAGMQIPAGVLLDRIGVRNPLTVCCLMLAAGAAIFSVSSNIFILSLARLMMGIGSAFGFLSNVKVGTLWFPPKRLSLVIGFTLFFGTMGAVFGLDPLARLIAIIGWREAMMAITFVGLGMALVCWFVIEDRPLDVVSDEFYSTVYQLKWIFDSILVIVKNPMTWILGSYGFLMYFPLAGFADLWGKPYLQSAYHLSPVQSATLVRWFYIGIGLGSPLWPWVLTLSKNYRFSMILSAVLTCGLFGYVLYGSQLEFQHLAVLLFLIGIAAGGQFLAFVAVTDINTHECAATASGMHNMLCMISGIVVQPLIGFFIDRYATSECTLEEKLYPPEAYTQGLTVIAIALVGAIISCLFMRKINYLHETKPVKTGKS
jgi:sugar phosphate permease